jgi:hypothetical protein
MNDGHARPGNGEMIPYFNAYVAQAEGSDLIHALKKASDRLWETAYRIPTGYGDHRYSEGKWTIKEVLQHVIDTERILSYRALSFARGEATALPGFDEDAYAAHADAGRRELHQLLREHDIVRSSTLALFRSFSDEMLLRTGVANGHAITVRALGWTIAGHSTHHMNVIDQRYLHHEHT